MATDLERLEALSPAARSLLRTLEWTRAAGLKQYHGQASTPAAKQELSAAHLVGVDWHVENPEGDRLTVKRAGWRLARLAVDNARASEHRDL